MSGTPTIPPPPPAPAPLFAQPGLRRTPNLAHLLLFLAITVMALVLAEALTLAVTHPHSALAGLQDQRVQFVANALTYVLALAGAWIVFPLVWHRTFLAGIHWNAVRAKLVLIPAGIALGLASQGISSLLPAPNEMPIDKLARDPALIWLLVLFGVLFAPLFEEIVFRGFLLPGIAIIVDWLRLPRNRDDPAQSLGALDTWRAGDTFSPLATVIASILTSLPFALIHAIQLGFNWAPITLLVGVSLILCLVRVRTDSVAASTLLHASYNFAIFATLFVVTGGFHHMDKL